MTTPVYLSAHLQKRGPVFSHLPLSESFPHAVRTEPKSMHHRQIPAHTPWHIAAHTLSVSLSRRLPLLQDIWLVKPPTMNTVLTLVYEVGIRKQIWIWKRKGSYLLTGKAKKKKDDRFEKRTRRRAFLVISATFRRLRLFRQTFRRRSTPAVNGQLRRSTVNGRRRNSGGGSDDNSGDCSGENWAEFCWEFMNEVFRGNDLFL
ncbi:unnamed protein product [Microthlaspi erraticum]|uniref:Uncharacterized protein n=1 Tax=Microthlaspi erraticum TaxID=1685480 RepID=A0A6D2JXP8_9BRAS|nr:unnamed protein product [Microthlaspi erraticum]